jgi:hypothetical protein
VAVVVLVVLVLNQVIAQVEVLVQVLIHLGHLQQELDRLVIMQAAVLVLVDYKSLVIMVD